MTPEQQVLRAHRREHGQIYFITDEVAIKIGFSVGALGRMAELQASHHATLRLITHFVGSMSDEHELHRRFRHLKIRGEWYRKDPELEAFIEDVKANGPRDIPAPRYVPVVTPPETHQERPRLTDASIAAIAAAGRT